MLTIRVLFKQIHPNAKKPTRSTEHAMGYDLYCVCSPIFEYDISKEKYYKELAPGESYLFDIGIACAIQEGWGCLLWDRSGMGAKRNIHRLAGVIDADWRKNWMVSLINLSKETQRIYAGDRIAQGVFTQQINVDFEEVDVLPWGLRGEAGFGSSGA